MEQFFHYMNASWINIKRAPLPYALTVLIMSLGLGVFFSNATFYYWVNHDPLPHKSDKLFFPRIASMPFDCGQCDAPHLLSYRDIKLLSSSGIPSAQSAMYGIDGFARIDANHLPTHANLRFTQRDFFKMFDVPVLHGQVWPDNNARMEAIVSRKYAEKIFGDANVVGRTFLLDDRIFTVIAVLDYWEMLPKLYDVIDGGHLAPVEDIYLPLETAYDLNYRHRSSNTFEPVNQKKIATEGREKSLHRLQFWVELDTPEKVQAYKDFMAFLVMEEKKSGRHPSADANRLHPMSHILEAFNIDNREIKAYALVTLLFLVVCLFNASHLSLNRYLANQYEFSLRRALGASAMQLQLQMLVDVLISSVLSIVFASLIAWLGIALINHFLPGNELLAHWNGTLVMWLLLVVLLCNYLVALYPSLHTAFGSLSVQLKS